MLQEGIKLLIIQSFLQGFFCFLAVHFTGNITGKNHLFFPALLPRISCTLTAFLGHVVAQVGGRLLFLSL